MKKEELKLTADGRYSTYDLILEAKVRGISDRLIDELIQTEFGVEKLCLLTEGK